MKKKIQQQLLFSFLLGVFLEDAFIKAQKMQ